MSEIGLLIVIWVLPLALFVGLVLRGLEKLVGHFRTQDPIENVTKSTREKETEPQFQRPEINPKTGKKRKKHKDKRGYKRPS